MAVKPIEIDNPTTGQHYTLEFNRASVEWAENRGFDISALGNGKILSGISDLFYYAFRMHHKNVARAKTDALLDALGGVTDAPDGLFARLGELYSEGFNTLTDKSENPTVTVTF